ncbi:IclR family transcriptional regulator [Catenovulum adriaticum]|uniref:Transcriptional regulator n=1 Tax=Catenovulum adriaticum TaxID=2984846 RepID=A0ABY7AUV5_9ALTE|nr:transcriptional regulator [Catenovulum sp. TS8]WAJ72124.1 transcriptional regulator [Catenovulum sp. TS8]
MTNEKKPQLNQSLIDGIATLQELALSKDPVGCRELARKLDMEPTRVNRLLQTLDHIGIARKTSKRKYTSGSGMHVLSAQALFASGLINKIIEPLESLRKYNLIIALGMLWRDHVSYLYHAAPGMESVNALGRLGLYPASKGGVGMVLLAEQPDHYIEKTYQHKHIEGFGEDFSAFMASIKQIRQQGYSYIQTQTDKHTLAVAVGEPAFCAIALSGWIPENSVAELVQPLKQVAQQINEIAH